MSYSVMSDGGGGLASLIRPVVQPAAQTAVAPPATMQAPPSDPAPAQTTQDPLAALKASLLAQAPNADWNNGGIDRASELAAILNANGITDLSKISVGKYGGAAPQLSDFTSSGGDNPRDLGSGEAQANYDLAMKDYNKLSGLYYGDRNISGLADPNFQYGTGDNKLAWSADGKGHVNYYVQQNPDGTTSIVPSWQSSSDAGLGRDLLTKGAIFAGGAALGGAFGGALGGAGSGAGAAGGDALAAAAGDVGFDAGSNAIWGAGGAGAGGDALAAAQGDVGFDAGSNAIWNGAAPLGGDASVAGQGDVGFDSGSNVVPPSGGSLIDSLKTNAGTINKGASLAKRLIGLTGGTTAGSGSGVPSDGGLNSLLSALGLLSLGGGQQAAPQSDPYAHMNSFDVSQLGDIGINDLAKQLMRKG